MRVAHKYESGVHTRVITKPFLCVLFKLGYYLYVESSMPSWIKAGHKADLISPWMTPKPGGQCLKFYYTMYGRTMEHECQNGIK